MKIYITALAFLALLFSCTQKYEKEEEMNMEDMMKDFHGVQDKNFSIAIGDEIDGQPVVRFSNVTLYIPEGWVQEVPNSDLRAMQFYLERDKQAKIAGFYFGNLPDMVRENIDRWKAEFTVLDSSEEIQLVDDKITMVILKGTYQLKPSPMSMDFVDTKGYGTLAAIVPTDDGPYYFKLVAPANIIDEEVASFKKFLESYKISL